MSPETVFLNLWHTAVRANCGDQLVSSPGVVRHKVIRAECEHTAVGSLVGSHQPCQHQSEVEVGGRQAAPSPTSLVLGRCVPGDVFRCWIAEPGQNRPRVQLVLVTSYLSPSKKKWWSGRRSPDCCPSVTSARRRAARTWVPSPRRAAHIASCAAAGLPSGARPSPAVASAAARAQSWSTNAVQLSTSQPHALISSCSVSRPSDPATVRALLAASRWPRSTCKVAARSAVQPPAISRRRPRHGVYAAVQEVKCGGGDVAGFGAGGQLQQFSRLPVSIADARVMGHSVGRFPGCEQITVGVQGGV